MNQLAWAEIDLPALKHNLRIARQAAPSSKIMAVIKSDAYGHDAFEAAKMLSGADALAVARISEAVYLRKRGIEAQIVVLSGMLSQQDFDACFKYELTPVIQTQACLQLLLSQPTAAPLNFWLKVDTGMHRLGIDEASIIKAVSTINKRDALNCLGLMSHLSDAELASHPKNAAQHNLLRQIQMRCGFDQISLCNSAGILFHPDKHHEWVRPGIMLYGANPSASTTEHTRQLKPVMTVKARVIDVKPVDKGESVGYNETWTAERDSLIATIGIGYGDGYPRHAPNGTPVSINGKEYPLAGRVSMDLITVDVTGSDIEPGCTALLWGEGLTAERIAELADTISYQLFTGVTSRVEKRFIHA